MDNLLEFLEGRIADLTEIREKAENEEDWSMYDYSAGAIDAYDIIKMRLGN